MNTEVLFFPELKEDDLPRPAPSCRPPLPAPEAARGEDEGVDGGWSNPDPHRREGEEKRREGGRAAFPPPQEFSGRRGGARRKLLHTSATPLWKYTSKVF